MEQQHIPNSYVSWKQIGLVLLALAMGLVSGLLLSNAQDGAQTSFSTTELIAFTMSILLAGASIVLAISAIALGRASEQSVIQRSDESIRLQNEVFAKTTEALQRIESSTGVTEKRLEDIISGRVGDISHEVARLASREVGAGRSSEKELEERVRESLLRSIRAEHGPGARDLVMEQRQKELEEEETYQRNHERLLLSITNAQGVKVTRFGHGSPGRPGEELFDAVFTKNDNQIAVSTFRPNVNHWFVKNFVSDAATQLSEDENTKVVIVLFKDPDDDSMANTIREYIDNLREQLAARIHVRVGAYSDIDDLSERIVAEIFDDAPGDPASAGFG